MHVLPQCTTLDLALQQCVRCTQYSVGKRSVRKRPQYRLDLEWNLAPAFFLARSATSKTSTAVNTGARFKKQHGEEYGRICGLTRGASRSQGRCAGSARLAGSARAQPASQHPVASVLVPRVVSSPAADEGLSQCWACTKIPCLCHRVLRRTDLLTLCALRVVACGVLQGLARAGYVQ